MKKYEISITMKRLCSGKTESKSLCIRIRTHTYMHAYMCVGAHNSDAVQSLDANQHCFEKHRHIFTSASGCVGNIFKARIVNRYSPCFRCRWLHLKVLKHMLAFNYSNYIYMSCEERVYNMQHIIGYSKSNGRRACSVIADY